MKFAATLSTLAKRAYNFKIRLSLADAAGTADAGDLDHRMGDDEGGRRGAVGDRPFDRRRVQLGHAPTDAADQELGVVAGARLGADDVGVEAFDAMDEGVLQQEVQRPVDGDRRRRPAVTAEPAENFVGADGRMAAGDDLQHPAPL